MHATPITYLIPIPHSRQLNIILRYCVNNFARLPWGITPNDDQSVICGEEKVYIVRDDIIYTYSYHDLFSKESGLLDNLFVPLKWKDSIFIFESGVFHDQMGGVLPHLFTMSSMDTLQKVAYFLDNIILPSVD